MTQTKTEVAIADTLLRFATARLEGALVVKRGQGLGDALLEAAIDCESQAVKARDTYETHMTEVAKRVVVARAVVIAEAKGQTIPNEVGELRRFMEQRVPEWAALLAKHDRDVDWAGHMMQWAFDPKAAQARRDAAVERQETVNERNALIRQESNTAHMRRVNPATPVARQQQTLERAVTKGQLGEEVGNIGAAVRRIAAEDRPEALDILRGCVAELRRLL